MALPDFADWPRPWKQGEIDEDKVARLVYNLKGEIDGLKTKVAEKDAELATAATDLDAAKASKSGTDEDAQNEIKDLTKKVRDLEAAKGKSLPADETKIFQLQAALRLGLDEEDAERLRGKDFDEILEDGKDFAKRHGIELEDDEDDGDRNGNPAGFPGQQPITGLRTGNGGRQKAFVKPDAQKAMTDLPPLRY